MNDQRDSAKRQAAGKLSRREFIKLSVMAGAAGMAGALAGCKPAVVPTPTAVPATEGAKAISVAPGTKLTMKLRAAFIPQANEILTALVKDWGAKNNVPVEIDVVSMNDLQTITATAAETGAGPDIVEINQASAHLFAEALADVSDVADDLGGRYGGWYTAAEEACKVEGKWLALPRFFASHAINYRKDLFDQVGAVQPPKTWEELLEIGKKLKAAGLPQIAFPLGHAVGDGNDFCYSVLWSYGASDIAKDGKTVAIDSPETRAALEFMKRLYTEAMPEDVLSYDDSANNRSFQAGSISATNNAASIYINSRNQGIKIKVGDEEKNLVDLMDHFEYPAGPAGRLIYAEFMAQAVFKYSPNQEAAKALLTFLNEEAQLLPWAAPAYSFIFPALKDFKDDPIMPWNTQSKIAAFKNYAADSHLPGFPSANFRGGTEAYAKWIVVDMFANYCSGAKDLEGAVAEAATQLKAIYGG